MEISLDTFIFISAIESDESDLQKYVENKVPESDNICLEQEAESRHGDDDQNEYIPKSMEEKEIDLSIASFEAPTDELDNKIEVLESSDSLPKMSSPTNHETCCTVTPGPSSETPPSSQLTVSESGKYSFNFPLLLVGQVKYDST